MKISIIVPVYNVERYLKQCLDSIVHQTYQNLEIICVDDGSTDSCGEILDAYAKTDSRIKVIHKENAGYGHSMNCGLKLATGDYIGIVESDDYIAPDMYEKLLAIVDSSDEEIEVVRSNYYEVSEESCSKKWRYKPEYCNRIIQVMECPEIFIGSCNIWTAIYKREFLLRNEISFLETPGASYQDTSFYFKTLIMAEKMFITEDAFYHYRVDNVFSSVKSNKKLFCVCDETDEIKRYCKERNLFHGDVEGFYYAIMFRVYIWNYDRLHVLLRSAFWIRFEEELHQMMKSKFFQKKFWTSNEWELALKITRDTDAFFWNSMYEFNIWECDKLTINAEWYVDSIDTCLKKEKSIYIYGAGIVANRVYKYLELLELTEKMAGFVVTDTDNNPQSIYGKKVYSVDCLGEKTKDALVIVAVSEPTQLEILKKIRETGHMRVVRVDRKWHEKIKSQVN